MTTPQDIKLLVDLAKLFDKYGTEPFERLADSLSSPETTQVWADFLRKSSRVAQDAGFERNSKRKQPSPRSAKAELENIKSEDPEKYEALSGFRDVLLSKAVLPTLRDIRYFAEGNGLPAVKSSSREKAISPLVKSLIPLPTDEINSIIGSLWHSDAESFNDLVEWSEIIMGKKHRQGIS